METNNQDNKRPMVLLADDEEDFRLTTSQILKSSGYSCVAVGDAESAREALQNSRFDLLIADINMPGNEDLSLLDYVQAHAPNIPIIVITGVPTVDSAVKAVGLNVCNYLLKPFNVDGFLAEVKKAVKLSILRHSIDDSMGKFLRITDQLALLRQELGQNKTDIAGASSNFLTVLVGGIVDSLSSGVLAVNRMEEGLAPLYSQKVGRETAEQDNQMLLSAIKETIATLEKTKQSFKSKDLGILRNKLNVALQVIDSKEPESVV